MPEQVVVERDAHADQPFAVIDQQPHVELDAGQLRRPAARSTPSRSAARATASASMRSDLPRSRPPRRASAISLVATRTTRSPLAEQKPLERARDVPAVLQRPHPLVAQAARPRPAPRKPALADRDRLLAQQLAGARADRGDGVRALVHVRTEHDHHRRPLSPRLKVDARRTRLAWGRCHAPIKSRQDIPTGDERHSESQSGQHGRQPEKRVSSPPVGTLSSASDVTDTRIRTASVKALALGQLHGRRRADPSSCGALRAAVIRRPPRAHLPAPRRPPRPLRTPPRDRPGCYLRRRG